jgi:hypothetical protein
MRRLLLKLGLMALPFAGFLVWFEVARGGRESNQYVVKRHRLEAAAGRIQVLVTGSSHAHEGIVPALVHSNAFNLAAVSQSLRYDCALVHRHAPRLPALRLVVVPVSYFVLQSELDRGPEAWRAYYYLHYDGIPHRDWRLDTHLRNWSAWELFGRDFGLSALRGAAPELVADRYDDAGGLRPERRPPPIDPKGVPDPHGSNAVRAAARHHAGMNPALVAGNRARLAELLAEMKRRGVDVVFVTLPVSTAYRSAQRPETVALNAATLEGPRREFGTEWHDYSADPRFADRDFQDADHLGAEGAAKFIASCSGGKWWHPRSPGKSPGRPVRHRP